MATTGTRKPLSLSTRLKGEILEGKSTIDPSRYEVLPDWDLTEAQKGSIFSLDDTENVRYYVSNWYDSYSTIVPEVKPPSTIPTPEQQAAYHQTLTEEYVRLHKSVSGLGRHAEGLDKGLTALKESLEAQRAEAGALAATQAELARLQQQTEQLIVERLDAIEDRVKRALDKLNDRLDLLDSDVVILNRKAGRTDE